MLIGDIPIIALAAGSPEMPMSLSSDVKEILRSGWHSLQHDHASKSTCGEVRIVEGCGHSISKDTPEAVEVAVRDLLNRIEDSLREQFSEQKADEH